MKIKKGKKIFLSDDFWYSLFDGGDVKPEELIVNQDDCSKVIEAMDILEDFKKSCDKRIEYM